MRALKQAKQLLFRPGRRALLSVLVFFVVSCSWASWRPAHRFSGNDLGPSELRVVTWNVGYFALAKNKNARDVDATRIADILEPLTAQIIVLQELGSTEQADAIVRSLGGNWRVLCGETGHRNQIIAVLSKLPIGEMELKKAGGRTMIGVSVNGENDKDIFILGVHSPHPGRGMQDTIDNIRGAVAWIDDRNEPIRIVAGDMNYNFDAEDSINEKNNFYGEIMSVLSDSSESIGETYYAHTRIDHVFHFPKDLDVVENASGMVDLSMRFAKVPGWRDHRPIVVTYQIDN